LTLTLPLPRTPGQTNFTTAREFDITINLPVNGRPSGKY
jgi:hypothetical protein